MEFEERRIAAGQALHRASDIVNECIMRPDVNWYIKSIHKYSADLFGHSLRVAFFTAGYCCFIGQSQKETETAIIGALLHDIGKIFISKDILEKPGRLTVEEYEIVKGHPEIGYTYLPVHQFNRRGISDRERKIVLQHHENWDGSGYPYGLKEKEIDKLAGIVHICDVYDALISKRMYKEAFPRRKAVQIMLEDCGSKFSSIQLMDFFTWLSAVNEGSLGCIMYSL